MHLHMLMLAVIVSLMLVQTGKQVRLGVSVSPSTNHVSCCVCSSTNCAPFKSSVIRLFGNLRTVVLCLFCTFCVVVLCLVVELHSFSAASHGAKCTNVSNVYRNCMYAIVSKTCSPVATVIELQINSLKLHSVKLSTCFWPPTCRLFNEKAYRVSPMLLNLS